MIAVTPFWGYAISRACGTTGHETSSGEPDTHTNPTVSGSPTGIGGLPLPETMAVSSNAGSPPSMMGPLASSSKANGSAAKQSMSVEPTYLHFSYPLGPEV